MTCTCHDPTVFGHHHEPPTFRPGESFTITETATWLVENSITASQITSGGIIYWDHFARTIQDYAIPLEAVRNLPYPPETPWNWLEAPQTAQNLLELRPTPQTFTNAPPDAPGATGSWTEGETC